MLHLPLSAARNPSPSFGGVASIAANNTLHSVWPLALGLLDAQQQRVTQLLADATVLANLLVTGMLVGGAVGGYGVLALAFLGHVPLEWAGIAVGGAGWLVERERPLEWRERAGAVGLIAGVLVCAAAVEIWLVPHR